MTLLEYLECIDISYISRHTDPYEVIDSLVTNICEEYIDLYKHYGDNIYDEIFVDIHTEQLNETHVEYWCTVETTEDIENKFREMYPEDVI